MSEAQVNMNALIRQIKSDQYEIKVHALASMFIFLRDDFISFGFFEEDFDSLFEAIFQVIIYDKNKHEHDLALSVINVLSLNFADEIEENIENFIKKLLPDLENVTNPTSYRFFAIAFSLVFSCSNDELTERVVREYIELILNRKGRPPRLSPYAVSYLYTGLNLILSIFPPNYATKLFKDDLEAVIINGIHSANIEIAIPAIEMAGVIYEAYVNEENMYYLPEEQSRLFSMKFVSKLEEAGDRIRKKNEIKIVKNRVKDIQEFLRGKETFVKYIFLEQEVRFNNIQAQVIVNTLKDILKGGFQAHMIKNSHIQSILEYRLKGLREALIDSKAIKKSQQSREGKKEKDLSIEKKRKQKEERMQDDFY